MTVTMRVSRRRDGRSSIFCHTISTSRFSCFPTARIRTTLFAKNGLEKYNAARGKAATFMRFALDAAVKGRKLNNAKQKAEAIEDFLPIVAAIRNNIQKRETFDQAMEFFHVEDTGLKRDLWNSVNDTRAVRRRR